MSNVSSFFRKLSLLFSRNRFRSQLDDEMAFHRAEAERELRAAGMPAPEARYAAMRQLGNATRLREQSHEQVGFRVETVMQDVRFALRQLRKNPGFAVLGITILALGIGVSVAMFGFVDAALIQPLPYAAPNRLLDVAESAAVFPRSNLSREDYEDWKRMDSSLSALEVYSGGGFLLRSGSYSEPVPAARVSDGFFRVLGVRPILGRDFLPGEDRPGAAKIVMLPYGTWQKRFSGRKDVIGTSVNLSGDNYVIVGVLPREFSFAPRGTAEFWVPLLDKTGCEKRRSCHNLYGVGRLRDGVGMEAARADLKEIAAQLAVQYPGSNKDQGAFVQPLSELVVGDVRPILLTLLGGACLLLLITCVNVASLLLVRSESRRREIGVRGALGATSGRLLRQFVTEGLLLAILGCGTGLLFAAWVMSLLVHMVPLDVAAAMPFLGVAGLNAHTAAFGAAVALMTAALLALTPAIRLAKAPIQEALTDGGRGAAGRFWQRLGSNLVVVELTIAVVLLTGAGLLGRSLYNVLHVDTGFNAQNLATVDVAAPDSMVSSNQQAMGLYREIQRRVSALPGVRAVAIASDLPVQCNCDTDWIRFEGRPFHGEHNEVLQRDVSPGYLPAMQARLISGRMLADTDDASHPQVIVINEALARKYFPGQNPLGHRVGNGDLAPESMREIVGVVADVREGGLDQDVWPTEYESLYRSSDSNFSVVVRTAQDEKSILPDLVSTLRGISPNLGVYNEQTMQQRITSTQAAMMHRFSTWLVGGFAALALVLGVVGLYGVIAYSVGQRTREIGVRMALGAQRSTVYSMVMKQAGWLTAIGLALGIVCSIAACLSMRKLLFGVAAWDVATLAAVAAVLGLASLMASFIPARRAASVNPSDALRAE